MKKKKIIIIIMEDLEKRLDELKLPTNYNSRIKKFIEEIRKCVLMASSKQSVTVEIKDNVRKNLNSIEATVMELTMETEKLKGRMMESLRSQNSELQRTKRLEEDLKEARERGRSFTRQISVAPVVSPPPSRSTEPEGQTVIVDLNTDEDIRIVNKELRDLAKAKKINAPKDVILANNKIIIKTKSKEDAQNYLDNINASEVLSSKSVARLPKEKKYRLILFGAPTSLEGEQLKQELTGIEGMEDGKVEVIKDFIGKNGKRNWLIDVNMQAKNFLLSSSSVLIDFTRVRLANYVSLTRCFKCQGFGHTARRCHSTIKCVRCAGAHDIKDCGTEEEECANCGEGHRADSKECECFKKYKNDIMAKRL